MFRFKPNQQCNADLLLCSQLFDQTTFYNAFLQDLQKAQHQVIIESPFITSRRVNMLLPTFRRLMKRGTQLVINTKPITEHGPAYAVQAEEDIAQLQELGAIVLLTGGHHRKLAIIDKQITWEGSLNILSQGDSCEIMRRIHSEQLASQMLAFLHLEKFITEVV